MITSSISPSLNSRSNSPSSRAILASSRNYAPAQARHKLSSSSLGDRPVTKQASPRQSSQRRPQMVDAATQYSPPDIDGTAAGLVTGKRKERSTSPENSGRKLERQPSRAEDHHQVDSTPSTSQNISSSTTSKSSDVSSPKRAKAESAALKIMPAQYETCDVKDLVLLISAMLMDLIRFNDAIPLQDGQLTRFHSRAPPGISVQDYLQRLTTHATLSPPILLSMVFLIDRLCALYPTFTISSLTVHRFLITAATVASKGLSDSFWTNSLYARVGGVSLKELALLELELLWRVEWRIVPQPEVLEDYYKSLIERSEGFHLQDSDGTSDVSMDRG